MRSNASTPLFQFRSTQYDLLAEIATTAVVDLHVASTVGTACRMQPNDNNQPAAATTSHSQPASQSSQAVSCSQPASQAARS